MKNNKNTNVTRPVGINERVWEVLKKVANELWNEYDQGKSVKRKVMISCKEFYEMLLDENGTLILDNKSLIRFANNGHIKTWSNELLMNAINFMQNGATDLAIEKLELHLALDNKSFVGRLKLAQCFQIKGKYKTALNRLNEAVHLQPNNEAVYINRAQLYSQIDLDNRAIHDLNFALLLNPKSFDALKMRVELRISNNELEEAVKDIKIIDELIPNQLDTLMLKGSVLMAQEKWPQAYRIFKNILAKEPFNTNAIVKLAMIKIEFKVEEHTALKDLEFARSLGHPKANYLLNELIQNYKDAA